MKKLMMLLLSFICLSASIAEASTNTTPICPNLGQVLGVTLEEAMYYGGEYDYVAYYDDMLHLGTPSLWYEVEVNLNPNLEKGKDEREQILTYAKDRAQYIDTQVNQYAAVDSLYGIQLYVCYYKSSNPNVKARMITATPIENGYLYKANAQHIAAGLAQLAR